MSPGFSDHLAFFGQIDIAAIVKNSTKTASELKSDATMEDAAGMVSSEAMFGVSLTFDRRSVRCTEEAD